MPKLLKLRFFLKLTYFKAYYFQRKISGLKRLEAKTKNILKHDPRFKSAIKDKDYLKRSKTFLKENFDGYKNTDWHHFYSTLNNIKKVEYMPAGYFHAYMMPIFNKLDLSQAYGDKNSYDAFFHQKHLPVTIYKIFRGRFFTADNDFIKPSKAMESLQNMDAELVIKPAIFSGMGKNVVIDSASRIAALLGSEEKYQEGSYIIQKKIVQHADLSKFHPSSVNTYRIMTARVESKIVVLGAYFRIGRNNVKVDNGAQGGLMCSIAPSGKISEYAIDMDGNRYGKHPDSNLGFKDITLPAFDKAVQFCKVHHKRILRFTIISWDIAIDENENPVFIEYNFKHPAIKGHQLLEGPLFGEYTDYFIELYKKMRETNTYHQTT